MADQPKADIVMMFVDNDGNAVWAESTLSVLTSDDFLAGFEPIDAYDDYSNFFEVTTFSFEVKLNPQDSGTGALSKATPSAGGASSAQAAPDQFARWRSATNREYPTMHFPLEFDNFTFTRVIDGASPIFFDACCNQTSFRSAALVRRVSTGAGSGPDVQAQGFLRFDFKDVLLTGIDWDDGDLVTETCTFICKAMRVRYRQQTAGSGLLAPNEATWDQKKDGSASGTGSA